MTSTPSATDTRGRLTGSDLLAAGGVLALGTAFALSPDHIEDGAVICPFRRLTGLPCPGCGLTRSWVYAAHGWWRESFQAHAFGLVAAAVVAAFVVLVVVARVRRTPPPDLNRWARHPVAIGVISVWLVWALVRLAFAL